MKTVNVPIIFINLQGVLDDKNRLFLVVNQVMFVFDLKLLGCFCPKIVFLSCIILTFKLDFV